MSHWRRSSSGPCKKRSPANASRLVVTGQIADSLLAVEVIDDGTGFGPGVEREAPVDGHRGVPAMAEWIGLAGGSVDIRSAPNAGTTISITVPISSRSDKSSPRSASL